MKGFLLLVSSFLSLCLAFHKFIIVHWAICLYPSMYFQHYQRILTDFESQTLLKFSLSLIRTDSLRQIIPTPPLPLS